MRLSSILSVVILCSWGLLLTGCQKEKPVDTSRIDAIANDILTAISAGQADKVYDNYFTPEYRKSLSREVWKEMVDAYSKKLGPVISMKRVSTSTVSIDGDVAGSFGFAVTWKNGPGTVKFNMSLRETWLLVNLFIDSAVFDVTSNPVKPASDQAMETKQSL